MYFPRAQERRCFILLRLEIVEVYLGVVGGSKLMVEVGDMPGVGWFLGVSSD
jgi:hypothetical protein